jgi:hypothetical protein
MPCLELLQKQRVSAQPQWRFTMLGRPWKVCVCAAAEDALMASAQGLAELGNWPATWSVHIAVWQLPNRLLLVESSPRGGMVAATSLPGHVCHGPRKWRGGHPHTPPGGSTTPHPLTPPGGSTAPHLHTRIPGAAPHPIPTHAPQGQHRTPSPRASRGQHRAPSTVSGADCTPLLLRLSGLQATPRWPWC